MTGDPGRSARLRAFLGRGAGLPFVWGVRDCSLWACDWIIAERGIDPAAHLRGTYGGVIACNRLLRREGGLPALAGRLARSAGLEETETPVAGDVGVIVTGIGPFLMLCAGAGWAWKTTDGVLFAPAAPLKAWAV